MEALLILLAQGVGVIVTTIMGTELFKSTFPNLKARTVTWIVWVLVGAVVYFVLKWFSGPIAVLLVVAASGIYAQVLKPLVWPERLRIDPPVGGGGSGPIP